MRTPNAGLWVSDLEQSLAFYTAFAYSAARTGRGPVGSPTRTAIGSSWPSGRPAMRMASPRPTSPELSLSAKHRCHVHDQGAGAARGRKAPAALALAAVILVNLMVALTAGMTAVRVLPVLLSFRVMLVQ